ncbi:MAG: hypothetical protein INQ03_11225 [Candidatus Heimdallarchaeota archaeon]|nr:hypothetical protein [Candidatus Heimdallarchaeota archaeon]
MRRYLQSGIRIFLMMASSSLCAGIGAIFELFTYSEAQESMRAHMMGLAYSYYIIATLFVFLFSEHFTRENVRTSRLVIHTILVGFTVKYYIQVGSMEMKNTDLPFYDINGDDLWLVASNLLVFAVASYFILDNFLKALKFAKTDENRKRIYLMILGYIFAGFLTPFTRQLAFLFLSSSSEMIQAIFIGIVPNIFLAVGSIIISIPYVTSKDISFLASQHYYHLLIIREGGVLLWEYQFPQENKTLSASLFSSGITAITELIQETAGIEANLEMVKFEGRILIVRRYENVIGILITEFCTEFLRKALYDMVVRFKEEIISTDLISYIHDDDLHALQIMQQTLGMVVET